MADCRACRRRAASLTRFSRTRPLLFHEESEGLAVASIVASHLLRLQWLLAATDMQRKFARFVRATKANFNPDQPRVPAGNTDGGQWTSGGGGGGSAKGKADGHHFVPKAVYRGLPLRPETKSVFDQGATGRLNAGRHAWSKEHSVYNDAVSEQFKRFLSENGLRPEDMTPDDARRFLGSVKRSSDPRIRGFNMRLYMREIMYWLRRIPRVTE
jgi:hypothetical protein